uniref:Alpha-type protein kinase domain-containing protein n=1 Tax=Eutreptiella gymnastica TaxID=73025 RepID=A0A7S4LLU9_9EUGL
MEDAHKKGFLTEQALEEIRKEGEKKVEDLFPPAKEFEGLDEEVTKRWYDWDNKSWETGKCTVAIAKEQFAEGGMRVAHFMLVKNPGKEPERWVAKRQKEDPDDETVYDADVIMQAACQAIAKAFNARVGPADSVEFVDCHTIKTASGTWWACEPYLQGKYIKYNNNYGYVDKRARNTPQAFTHFSYEFTNKKMMVVDIQGVDDKYTDPQIHTADGQGFGMGNIGKKGMERFLKTHWCNSLCMYLGLEFCTPKILGVKRHHKHKDSGTHHRGSVSASDQVEFKLSDYLGDLEPKKGGATADDLALLGIDEKQFNAIVVIFRELDKDGSGYLDKEELYQIFQKAKVSENKTTEAEAFLQFISRMETKVNENGKVYFKDFLLCWTGND